MKTPEGATHYLEPYHYILDKVGVKVYQEGEWRESAYSLWSIRRELKLIKLNRPLIPATNPTPINGEDLAYLKIVYEDLVRAKIDKMLGADYSKFRSILNRLDYQLKG